jgi:hypothetical protein
MTLNLTKPDNTMAAKSPEALIALASSGATGLARKAQAEIQRRRHEGLKQARGGENA